MKKEMLKNININPVNIFQHFFFSKPSVEYINYLYFGRSITIIIYRSVFSMQKLC